MLNQCPFCQQPITLTGEQQTRLEQALVRLTPGKLLSLKCPHCRGTIAIDRTGQPPQASSSQVQPPPPPNLDWLKGGQFKTEDKLEDVPMALVLHQAGEARERIGEALESVGYQVFMTDNAAEAMERMRFVAISCVIFQADLEGPLAESSFHDHMRGLAMDRRRYIFYALIGPELHTLYNLEALAYSANLTVNTADLPHLDVILRKSIPLYDELFGPLLDELNAYGKG